MSIDIDRPVNPAPPPWFDGWPPLWEECIFQNDGQDYVVMPIAYYDGSVVFAAGDDYPFDTYDGCSRLESFRPMRTDAQPEWTGTGHPSVGTECEVLDSVNGKWNSVQITAVSRDHLVVIFNGEEALLKKNCQFRSIRSQNRDKWGRGIDFLAEMVLSGNVLLDSKFLGEQARNADSYFYNPKAMIRDQSQREKGWIVGRAAVALQEAHGLTPKAYQKYCLTLYGAGMLRRAGE
jgi:hypothetical protein